jgi:putative ABC transport system ATP-binding protein
MTPLRLRDVVQSRGTGHRMVTVLRGVSLEVRDGDRVLLQGPSGSGKTTLLAVAAGLLTPGAGEVTLGGRDLIGMPPEAKCRLRAGLVGFVFQRSNLLSGLTVLENVALAGQLAGLTPRDAGTRARELLGRLGLGGLLARFPRELSGGEEQRVAVARALVHRPPVVLADEPTGNLDREAGQEVARALVELVESTGGVVVVATHDVRLAPLATRWVRLQDGLLTEEPGGRAA